MKQKCLALIFATFFFAVEAASSSSLVKSSVGPQAYNAWLKKGKYDQAGSEPTYDQWRQQRLEMQDSLPSSVKDPRHCAVYELSTQDLIEAYRKQKMSGNAQEAHEAFRLLSERMTIPDFLDNLHASRKTAYPLIHSQRLAYANILIERGESLQARSLLLALSADDKKIPQSIQEQAKEKLQRTTFELLPSNGAGPLVTKSLCSNVAPTSFSLKLAKACEKLKKKKYDSARTVFTELIENENTPSVIRAQAYLALGFDILSNGKDAEQYFKEAASSQNEIINVLANVFPVCYKIENLTSTDDKKLLLPSVGKLLKAIDVERQRITDRPDKVKEEVEGAQLFSYAFNMEYSTFIDRVGYDIRNFLIHEGFFALNDNTDQYYEDMYAHAAYMLNCDFKEGESKKKKDVLMAKTVMAYLLDAGLGCTRDTDRAEKLFKEVKADKRSLHEGSLANQLICLHDLKDMFINRLLSDRVRAKGITYPAESVIKNMLGQSCPGSYIHMQLQLFKTVFGDQDEETEKTLKTIALSPFEDLRFLAKVRLMQNYLDDASMHYDLKAGMNFAKQVINERENLQDTASNLQNAFAGVSSMALMESCKKSEELGESKDLHTAIAYCDRALTYLKEISEDTSKAQMEVQAEIRSLYCQLFDEAYAVGNDDQIYEAYQQVESRGFSAYDKHVCSVTLKMAHYCIEQENFDRAKQLYTKLMGAHDKAIMSEAQYCYAMRFAIEKDEREKLLESVVKIGLEDANKKANAYYQLGLILTEKNKWKDAIEFFDQAADVDSFDEQVNVQKEREHARLRYARECNKKGMRHRALEHLAKVASQDMDVEAQAAARDEVKTIQEGMMADFDSARELYENKDYKKAYEIFSDLSHPNCKTCNEDVSEKSLYWKSHCDYFGLQKERKPYTFEKKEAREQMEMLANRGISQEVRDDASRWVDKHKRLFRAKNLYSYKKYEHAFKKFDYLKDRDPWVQAEAKYYLGLMYYYGHGVAVDTTVTKRLMNEVANQRVNPDARRQAREWRDSWCVIA
jgi:tetratricopeptide (TPR) repeat protein